MSKCMIQFQTTEYLILIKKPMIASPFGLQLITFLNYCLFLKMDERTKIQKGLELLREQCVREYLQTKLQAITSKEVVYDIVQGFLEANNHQFLQNVTENILEVKNQNKRLKELVQATKTHHSTIIKELSENITKQYQEKHQKEIEEIQEITQSQLGKIELALQKEKSNSDDLRQQLQKCSSLIEKYEQNSSVQKLLVAQKCAKLKQLQMQNINVKEQLTKSKQSFNKFKDSCQKIINDTSRQKQRQKIKYMAEIQKERSELRQKQITKKSQREQKLEQELAILVNQVRNRENTIKQLSAELASKHQQVAAIKLKYQQLVVESSTYFQLNAKLQTQMAKQLKNKQIQDKQIQRLQLVQAYLKQQNNYLRQQILSFSNRSAKIEQQKHQLNLEFQQFKTTTKTEHSQINQLYLKQGEIHRQNFQQFKQQSQSKLIEMIAELNQLREELQQFQNIVVQKQTQIQTLNSTAVELQTQNETMKEQIKTHFDYSDIHQNEIKLYEQQITKVKQQCRAEIKTYKQTYELNWKSTNQQLIQQKYKNAQLNQRINQLQQQCNIGKQKEKYYGMYLEEIGQLKKQLQFYKPKKNQVYYNQTQKGFQVINKKTKLYFCLSKINEEIQYLKNQNSTLKSWFIHQITQFNDYHTRTIQFIIAKCKQESIKCSYNQHQNFSKISNFQANSKQQTFGKTVAKGAMCSNSNFVNIKKTLKNIQKRYQTVNEENVYYSERVEAIIRKV